MWLSASRRKTSGCELVTLVLMLTALVTQAGAAQESLDADPGREVRVSLTGINELSLQASGTDPEAGEVGFSLLLKTSKAGGRLQPDTAWKPSGTGGESATFEALHVKVYAGKEDRRAIRTALAQCLEEASELLGGTEAGALEIRVPLGERGVAALQSGSKNRLLLVLRDGLTPECRLQKDDDQELVGATRDPVVSSARPEP